MKQLSILSRELLASGAPVPGARVAPSDPGLRAVDEPHAGSELRFGPRDVVVSATLPQASPPGDPPIWYRANGRITLSIRPAYAADESSGEPVYLGYPYGSIPRLLLFWMTTEVLRTGSRTLVLGSCLNTFLRDLGLSPRTGGGPRSDAMRLRYQMERLLRCPMSIEYSQPGHVQWIDMQVAPRGELFWDAAPGSGQSVQESWIELGELFFQFLTAHPVPVDRRVLQQLKGSPLALDVYAWLGYSSFVMRSKVGRPFVPWRSLREQFGSHYADAKNFKRRVRGVLTKLLQIHGSRASFEVVTGGVDLLPGRVLIPPRQ